MTKTLFRSIFTPATEQERKTNFENYWEFTQRHGGEFFESEKNLANKRSRLNYFRDNPVRLLEQIADPSFFYRNYVDMKDDPASSDRLTLMLTCIYKFARHEWVGIEGAWISMPEMARLTCIEDRISRIHLAEEFCHIRLFEEMLRTCGMDQVEWVRQTPLKEAIYRIFPRLPGFLMDTPAFVTELMGVIFYCHLYALFDEVFTNEPEVRNRMKEILDEITVDEISHVGQRRNFIGAVGIKISRRLVKPFFNLFFRDIPEVERLFDVDRMIREGLDFDYNGLPACLIERSWIPSYCRADAAG
ncbi:MAG: hypothetical protein ACU826_02225 [Gammaproteobacteria bacterium]